MAANRGVLKRTLGYLSYTVSAPLAALGLRRPDVIVATSPQFFCACTGFLAARLLRCPWVFELRDLWPESLAAVGAVRSTAVIQLLEALELHLYRDADAVVAVTEPFKDNLTSRGIEASKIQVVTNGMDFDSWDLLEQSAARRQLHIDERKFVACYVGTLGMAHRLETMLDAAAILQNEPTL